jgi:hypothetical protein
LLQAAPLFGEDVVVEENADDAEVDDDETLARTATATSAGIMIGLLLRGERPTALA